MTLLSFRLSAHTMASYRAQRQLRTFAFLSHRSLKGHFKRTLPAPRPLASSCLRSYYLPGHPLRLLEGEPLLPQLGARALPGLHHRFPPPCRRPRAHLRPPRAGRALAPRARARRVGALRALRGRGRDRGAGGEGLGEEEVKKDRADAQSRNSRV